MKSALTTPVVQMDNVLLEDHVIGKILDAVQVKVVNQLVSVIAIVKVVGSAEVVEVLLGNVPKSSTFPGHFSKII